MKTNNSKILKGLTWYIEIKKPILYIFFHFQGMHLGKNQFRALTWNMPHAKDIYINSNNVFFWQCTYQPSICRSILFVTSLHQSIVVVLLPYHVGPLISFYTCNVLFYTLWKYISDTEPLYDGFVPGTVLLSNTLPLTTSFAFIAEE